MIQKGRYSVEENVVHIVHAVDTEGPLHESFASHFDRVNETFGVNIKPTHKNLEKLRNKEIDLCGNEEKASLMLAVIRIDTNASWDQIDNMLDNITSEDYRFKLKDSYGGGWVYNWFCMDHVGITGNNPRRRDMGYNNIHDHYREYFDIKNDKMDSIQWHYHPLSLTNDAHRAGSTYLNSGHIYNIISRRIIDRRWFPSSFRAGHHAERPDSNFFLEQWIPFDFSSDAGLITRANRSAARYGDWRGAPDSWIPYHPDHDDYKRPGTCRRYITKCLPINERAYKITQKDVASAFGEAGEHGASILSFTNHDFRNMESDIEHVRDLVHECSKNYSNVKFKYSSATDAMRGILQITEPEEIKINAELVSYKTHTRLVVKSENKIFGPQPYLAIKLKDGSYHWQNFDFEETDVWSYSFDRDNVLIEQVEQIGIAANNSAGLTEILNINPESGAILRTLLNK